MAKWLLKSVEMHKLNKNSILHYIKNDWDLQTFILFNDVEKLLRMNERVIRDSLEILIILGFTYPILTETTKAIPTPTVKARKCAAKKLHTRAL